MSINVEFKGIVRSTSPQNSADGNCEEIINLRQESGVWRAVGKKKEIVEDVNYQQVFIHENGDKTNYVGLKRYTKTVTDPTGMPQILIVKEIVWFDPATKEEKQVICKVGDNVQLEAIDNVLIVKDDQKVVSCVFKDNYLTLGDYPELPAIVQQEGNVQTFTSKEVILDCDQSKTNSENETMIRRFVVEQYEAFLATKKEQKLIEGRAFARLSYQLFDGTEVMHTPPFPLSFGSNTLEITGSTELSIGKGIDKAKITLHNLSMSEGDKLIIDTKKELERHKGVIQRINVYLTPLVSYIDIANLKLRVPGTTENWQIYASNYRREIEDFVDSLMYYKVASFPVTQDRFELNLDTNVFDKIMTNKDMPVDGNSRSMKTGDMFVYNKRLHLCNVTTRIKPYHNQMQFDVYTDGTSNFAPCYIQFVLREGMDTFIIQNPYPCTARYSKDESTGKVTMKINAPEVIVYPDSRATEIRFIAKGVDIAGYNLSSQEYYLLKIDLKSSSKYNFSYAVAKGYGLEFNMNSHQTVEPPAGGSENLRYTESGKVIVSEPHNPTVFNPQHTYSFDGEILGMAVNTEQISFAQVGQFPVHVFTTKGIFALQSGSGEVLYSNIVPVSGDTMVKGTSLLQTRYGIVFAAKDGLKIISGREVQNLSEVLNGPLDTNIRLCKFYKEITNHKHLYNIQPHLSQVPFLAYLKESALGYDSVKEEIIVSNINFKYSYVYSLKSRTWHKITDVFSKFSGFLAVKPRLNDIIPARAARASIHIPSAIVKPEMTFSSKVKAAFTANITQNIPKESRTSLLVGDMQIASFTSFFDLPLHSVIEELIFQSDEFETEFSANGFTIYSNVGVYAGKVIKIKNESRGLNIQETLSESIEQVQIPAKGIGQTIEIGVGEHTYNYTVQKGDDKTTITRILHGLIVGIEKTYNYTEIQLTAFPGSAGNDIRLIGTSSFDVILRTKPFAGGYDETIIPGESCSLCDLREEDPVAQAVHLQTRPMRLGSDSYKSLPRTIFRGEFYPVGGEKCNGAYIFVSNDCTNWYSVSNKYINKYTPVIPLNSTHGSYRYFILTFGGEVQPGHSIARAEIEGEEKWNNVIR